MAYTISWLEADPSLFDKLMQPMRMLCQYQLEHGAVVHHSKEHINYKSRKLLQSVNSTVVIVVCLILFLFTRNEDVSGNEMTGDIKDLPPKTS